MRDKVWELDNLSFPSSSLQHLLSILVLYSVGSVDAVFFCRLWMISSYSRCTLLAKRLYPTFSKISEKIIQPLHSCLLQMVRLGLGTWDASQFQLCGLTRPASFHLQILTYIGKLFCGLCFAVGFLLKSKLHATSCIRALHPI